MFPKIFNFFLFFLVLAGQKVLGQSIEDVKARALEQVEGYMTEHKKLVNETLTTLSIRESNLKGISQHIRETGNEIFDSTMYNIRKTAVTGLMTDILLGRPDGVEDCINGHEKSNYQEATRYYNQKFVLPADEYEKEADDIQSGDIRRWIEDYNSAALKFNEIYERTVVDIQKSRNVDDIKNAVDEFGRIKQEMGNVVTKINGYLDRLQLQFLQILDNLVFNIRNSLRVRVDRTIIEVRECFGTLLTDAKTGPLLFKELVN